MSIDSIVLLLPPIGQYGVIKYFTRQLMAAFERQGVHCNLVCETEDSHEFFKEIFNASPDCTLSFNGLLPDEKGTFFCDLIQIPHVACLVDSPTHFMGLAGSPYTIITCVDRDFSETFRLIKPGQVLFMPHATDKDLYAKPEAERKFDVVMFSSCINPEKIKNSWKDKFIPNLVRVIEKAAEITLSERDTPFLEAFSKVLVDLHNNTEKMDLEALNYESILDELESYICGIDRIELLKAIPKEITVHVYGAGKNEASWKEIFPDEDSNIKIHDSIPVEEAFEIMKQSKVVLNSSPSIKNGAHERIFNGIACGALVLTNDNPYIRKEFKDGEEILLFHSNHWKECMPGLLEVLKDDSKRCQMVNKAYEKVKHNHTWDVRAKMLLESLPQILEKL